jgi:hypothetical protein
VPIGMVADPPALLSRLARDDPADGRALVRLRPRPVALVGAPSRWIRRVRRRRALFPRRCGPARRLRRLSPASSRSGRSRGGDLEDAAAGDGVVCVTALIRVRGGRSARLWRGHAAGGRASLDVGESWQRPCWSGASRSRHPCGNGRPGKDPAAGRVGAHGDGSEGRRTPLDAGDAPATGGRCCHPPVR